jgi:hypothetical protein
MLRNDQCRNCYHYWEDHGHCGKTLCCYGEISTSGYIEFSCYCDEYIPGDNLEFLELEYGRKKLGSKFSSKSNKNL